MFELFYMGGPLFMGILTLLLLIIIIIAVISAIKINSGKLRNTAQMRHQLSYIKSVGIFALVSGILGQLIGLYSAFQQIEAGKDIAPSLMFAGLRVSSICTIYGILIFLIAYLFWFGLEAWLNNSVEES